MALTFSSRVALLFFFSFSSWIWLSLRAFEAVLRASLTVAISLTKASFSSRVFWSSVLRPCTFLSSSACRVWPSWDSLSRLACRVPHFFSAFSSCCLVSERAEVFFSNSPWWLAALRQKYRQTRHRNSLYVLAYTSIQKESMKSLVLRPPIYIL